MKVCAAFEVRLSPAAFSSHLVNPTAKATQWLLTSTIINQIIVFMGKRKVACAWIVAAILAGHAHSQIYSTNGVVVHTFAGSGQTGFTNSVGQQAMFSYPSQIVADSNGNLFVSDTQNAQIREIASDSTVSTFIHLGIGTNGKMAIDRNNNIYALAGFPTFYLYRILPSGSYTRTNLSYISPTSEIGGLCVDSTGNIYISFQLPCNIYKLDTNGVVTVFAGSGTPGYADLQGTNAAFNTPLSLACDAADNIYVWERGNYVIRRIDQSRNVTTFAGHLANGSYPSADGIGTNAVFGGPQAAYGGYDAINQMCCDRYGNLILTCASSVRQISAATNVTTLAGSFTQYGYQDGSGNSALFNGAIGVCVSGGTIYISDQVNERIRSITNNPPPQIVSPGNLQLNTYPGLQISGTIGRTYQIQCSPDMTNWATQATLILSSSPYLWIDQNPVSGNKFYRAFLLP